MSRVSSLVRSWFAGRSAGRASALPAAILEALEDRRLLSASGAATVAPLPPVTPPAPVGTTAVQAIGVTIHATAGKPFKGDVGLLRGLGGIAPDFRNLHASIDWGDGSEPTQATYYRYPAGTIHVYGRHTFAAGGTFTVTVTVSKTPVVPKGQPNIFFPILVATIKSKAVVAGETTNSPGGVTIHPVAGEAFTGKVGSFNSPIVDPPVPVPLPVSGSGNGTTTVKSSAGTASAVVTPPIFIGPFHATIDWGDGKTGTGTVKLSDGGAFVYDVTGTHTYAAPGKYHVHVTVTRSPIIVGPGPVPLAGAVASPVPTFILLVAQIDSTAVVTAPPVATA